MINCPWCHTAYEPSRGAGCPHCGTLPPAGERQPEVGTPPREEARPRDPGTPRSILDVLLGPGGGGLPWERRRELGLFRAAWLTIRGVLFSPFRTFRAMRPGGGYREPLCFVLVVAAPCFALSALMGSGARRAAPAGTPDPWSMLMPAGEPARTFLEVGLAPLAALLFPVGAWLAAHLCLLLFRQPGAGAEATFRVTCYAAGSASLLALLPLCGSVLLVIWYLAAGTIGLVMVHRARVLPAFSALALPPAALLVVAGIVMSVLAAARTGAAGR
jgi:hypothetical protein